MIWHPDSPIRGFSSHFLKLSVGCGAGFLLCYNGAFKCRKFKIPERDFKSRGNDKMCCGAQSQECHLQLVRSLVGAALGCWSGRWG